jgi:hypothetical protein
MDCRGHDIEWKGLTRSDGKAVTRHWHSKREKRTKLRMKRTDFMKSKQISSDHFRMNFVEVAKSRKTEELIPFTMPASRTMQDLVANRTVFCVYPVNRPVLAPVHLIPVGISSSFSLQDLPVIPCHKPRFSVTPGHQPPPLLMT